MSSDDDGDPEIHRTPAERKYLSAYKNDDYAAIDEMLKANEIDPNHRIGDLHLPLLMAIFDIRPNIVKTLIDNGANFADNRSQVGYDGKPLHLTLSKMKYYRQTVMMEREFDHGSSLMSIFDLLMGSLEKTSMETMIAKVFAEKDTMERTPFLLACRGGLLDDIVVRFLNLITDESRHFFTDMAWFIDGDRLNPFHFAWNMNPDTVSLLIDRLPFRKSLINMARYLGHSSPLHALATEPAFFPSTPLHGNLALIGKLLIGGSANPGVLNENGSTPLHYAVESYNEPVVETLLRAGCRLDIQNDNGDTPLAFALHRNRDLDGNNEPVAIRILELLLAFGVDLHKELYIYTEEENPEMFTDPDLPDRLGPGHIRPDWLEAFRQLRRSNDMNSLKRTCRNVIRRHLKPQADEVIKDLTCLPNNLKSYLLVENEPAVLI